MRIVAAIPAIALTLASAGAHAQAFTLAERIARDVCMNGSSYLLQTDEVADFDRGVEGTYIASLIYRFSHAAGGGSVCEERTAVGGCKSHPVHRNGNQLTKGIGGQGC